MAVSYVSSSAVALSQSQINDAKVNVGKELIRGRCCIIATNDCEALSLSVIFHFLIRLNNTVYSIVGTDTVVTGGRTVRHHWNLHKINCSWKHNLPDVQCFVSPSVWYFSVKSSHCLLHGPVTMPLEMNKGALSWWSGVLQGPLPCGMSGCSQFAMF